VRACVRACARMYCTLMYGCSFARRCIVRYVSTDQTCFIAQLKMLH